MNSPPPLTQPADVGDALADIHRLCRQVDAMLNDRQAGHAVWAIFLGKLTTELHTALGTWLGQHQWRPDEVFTSAVRCRRCRVLRLPSTDGQQFWVRTDGCAIAAEPDCVPYGRSMADYTDESKAPLVFKENEP